MRIAVDTGGTFTDVVFLERGGLRILKVLSTPHDPAQAIGNALRRIAGETPRNAPARHPEQSEGSLQNSDGAAIELVCGTTVGTNALLERRGGSVALVTTAGFEDVLEIGRQARPRLYDFFVERPAPLVPAQRRFGLRERIASEGELLLRPSPRELDRISRLVRQSSAQTVAVCLLFSFANPAHERAIARRFRALGLPVSVSHEILPEFREFERTATTVVNAYLVPVMSRYLAAIGKEAAASWQGPRAPRSTARRSKPSPRVHIMQSNGGVISAGIAAREPVRTILSGPAGGILGARYVARLSGFERLITFDMGGTSTDVALIDGEVRTTNEASVADLPVAVPVLDIHTVGAGGGSIARFDRAGALRVGPESAGAEPGPICYGRGERPTVTDAQLVLGRIAAGGFLGGEFQLDATRARKYMEKAATASRGAIRSVEDFAQGIVDVANATMEKAIRVISVERGYDPRDFTLVAFGGAGGLHACDLAAALGVPRVLLPKFPGALSALGILRADVVKELSQTVRLAKSSPREMRQELRRAFAALERRGRRDIAGEGFAGAAVKVERFLDCRYVGQGYELEVPASGGFSAAFHRAHERRYGYADPKRAVEIVNVRARFTGVTPKTELPRQRLGPASPRAAATEERKTFCEGRPLPTPFYDRAKLRPGHRLAGPAVISEYGATSFLPPGWRARVDVFENILFAPARR
jgi:N-methylhydantoinase A